MAPVLFIILFVCFFDLPGNTLFGRTLSNFGHFPLFGILYLIILLLLKANITTKEITWYSLYIWAAIITTLLGGITEFIQIFSERDADLVDFARDVAGVVFMMCCCVLRNPGSKQNIGFWILKTRVVIASIALAVLMVCSYPVVLMGATYFSRNKSFPVIFNFDSAWESYFYRTKGALITVVDRPEEWPGLDNDMVGQIIYDVVPYPTFSMKEPCRDWSKYKSLNFEIFSMNDTTIELAIRIDDVHHNNDFNDRFNTKCLVDSGFNEFQISLNHISQSPANRELDISSITAIMYFLVEPQSRCTIYIDNIGLE